MAPLVPSFATETAASASILRDRKSHPASGSFPCLFYFIYHFYLLCFPARFSVLSSIAHPPWDAAMPAARRVFLLILALLLLLLFFAVPTVSLAQEPDLPSPLLMPPASSPQKLRQLFSLVTHWCLPTAISRH